MTALSLAGSMLVAVGALNLAAALILILIAIGRPFRRTSPDMAPLALARRPAPFVSVHVATHDEPPAMVIATIESIARSDYPAFEIIVIDNNTADPATWRPVAERCAALGPHVRFYHRDGVVGAKAGALNIALRLTDPRTAYVAIVDADYQVAPDFIARGVAACGGQVQFVQFPQVYRDAGGADAVVAELSDYFETFPRAANRAQAALLTGTLSVIAIDALRSAGGWPTRSITEDAELGVRLWSRRLRGLFLPNAVGHGLLPLDLRGLRLQRQRWVSGNVQTLIGARRALLEADAGALAVVAQLTAWVGLLALPLLILVLAGVVRAFAGPAVPDSWRAAEAIGATTLLCVIGSYVVRALWRRRPWSVAVTLSLLWTSSFGWLSVLGGRPLRFRRTPKVAGQAGGGPSIDTIGSCVALAAAAMFAVEGVPLVAFALALSASGLGAAPIVDRWLRNAARQTGQPCAA